MQNDTNSESQEFPTPEKNEEDMTTSNPPIHAVLMWGRRQLPKVKAFLPVVSGMAALVLLLAIVLHDHDNLFVAAGVVHTIGISVLIYKLIKEKNCAGLSLKSQELTAIFLAVRLYCSFAMGYEIDTLLDSATLLVALLVICMIRFKLKSSYMEDKDNFNIFYFVVPCAVLALLINPSTSHDSLNPIFWAFCVYLEAVSVLPQLQVMENSKPEPLTAKYVFALGVARLFSCAHWVPQVLDGRFLVVLGYGLWPKMVLISELFFTFILTDFCYYYIKSVFGGQHGLFSPLVWSKVKMLGRLFALVWSKVKMFGRFFGSFFALVWSKVKSIVKMLAHFFGRFFALVWSKVKMLGRFFGSFFALVWSKVKSIVKMIGHFFGRFFALVWSEVKMLGRFYGRFFAMVWSKVKMVGRFFDSVFATSLLCLLVASLVASSLWYGLK